VPTLVLVGAPNVGKSSLVRVLSSGVPDVQNYPFTTRGIKLGHFYLNGERHVVTDTPGLLNRNEEDRNTMEALTIASIEHLPTSVMFVLDATALCGTTLSDQLAIRQELLERFPGRPWLDVLSKSDLLPLAAEARSYEPSDPSERLEGILSPGDEEPSPLDGIWKAEQRDSERQHEDLRINLHPDAQHQGLEAASDGFAEALSRVAEEMPSAIRVSVMTSEGIEELKHTTVAMLKEHQKLSTGTEKVDDQAFGEKAYTNNPNC
ncbi:hypothetical protein CYMTET_25422, partial [Cymbomonas tetramitiformis]